MANEDDPIEELGQQTGDLLTSIKDDTATLATIAARFGVNVLLGPALPPLPSEPPGAHEGKINLRSGGKQLLYKGSKEKCFVIKCTEGRLIIKREEEGFTETAGTISRGGSAKVCGTDLTVEATAADGTEPLNQGTWVVEEELAEADDKGTINVKFDDVQLVYSGAEEKCFIIECTEGRLVVRLDGDTLDAKIPRGGSAKLCGTSIIVQGDEEGDEDTPSLNQGCWTIETERRVF